MLRINRFLITVIQFVLIIDSTKQLYVKQAMTAVKTCGNSMKHSMAMFTRNKNTIKSIAYGVQKKYLTVRHNFVNKSVKYLGEEAIRKFKHTAHQAVRGDKLLFRTKGKKNIQMRSAAQINGKELGYVAKRSVEYMRGKEFSSLINKVSESKLQLPFLAGAGLTRLTEINALIGANPPTNYDDPVNTPPELEPDYEQLVGAGKYSRKQFKDGSIYEGVLVNGEMHGEGRLTEKSKGENHIGAVYEGNFVNGKYHGEGKLEYSNGDEYNGEFKDNKPNGNGSMRTDDEELYTGYFVDGKMQGKGTYYAQIDEKYGDNNPAEGIIFFDGDVADKKVEIKKEDPLEGYNKDLTWEYSEDTLSLGLSDRKEDGHVCYDGDFVDSKFEGNGVVYYQSLNKYEGEWKNNMRHGRGEQSFQNGDYYLGNWKDDLFSGEGEFFTKKTNKFTIGLWEKGFIEKEN